MYKRSLLLLFIFFFLTGCGTARIHLSPEDASQVKNIHIKPDITKPSQIAYQGRWANAGIGFGVIGLAAGKVSGLKDENEMRKLVAEHVNVTDIVYQQWARQMNQANFNLKQPEDAVLVVEISRYGIMIPNVFTNKYYPILHVKAKLERNNKTIWQDGRTIDGLTASENIPRYNFEEIKRDPKKLQAMLSKSSEEVISSMMQDMKSNK